MLCGRLVLFLRFKLPSIFLLFLVIVVLVVVLVIVALVLAPPPNHDPDRCVLRLFFCVGVSRPGLLEQRLRGDSPPRSPEGEPVQGQLRPVQGDGGAEEEAAGDGQKRETECEGGRKCVVFC